MVANSSARWVLPSVSKRVLLLSELPATTSDSFHAIDQIISVEAASPSILRKRSGLARNSLVPCFWRTLEFKVKFFLFPPFCSIFFVFFFLHLSKEFGWWGMEVSSGIAPCCFRRHRKIALLWILGSCVYMSGRKSDTYANKVIRLHWLLLWENEISIRKYCWT